MSRYQSDSLFESAGLEEPQCSRTIRVAFESAVDSEFDYLLADELWPIRIGQRVKVPFGAKNKLQIGFCVGLGEKKSLTVRTDINGKKRPFKLKKTVSVIDAEPLIDEKLMELARWISGYYVCPLGQVLAAMVPAAVKKGIGIKEQTLVYLAADYRETIAELRGKKQKQIVSALGEQKAFDSKNAVEAQQLLKRIGCTRAPLKKLAEKQIIRMVRKTVLKSLPAVPEGLILKQRDLVLNNDQEKALAHIKSRIDSSRFGVTVLHGVTDSGKTEVYIRAVGLALKKGKTAIVMLPEIALTAQTVQRFSSRFDNIAVMHSGLTAAQRNVQWQKIKAGKADVVIGARSAVFAPLPNTGLIVVDEEHDSSYKQDTQPRYNGRDVAIKRAQLANACCILGSATPSLETLFNCRSKKYFYLLSLPKRVMDLAPPQMKLVDMQQQPFGYGGVELVSEPLAQHLKEVLEKNEQAILLLNRRGYSNFIFCPSCKHTLHCRNCDVTLTFHKRTSQSSRMQTILGRHIASGYALCHYCGAQTLVPQLCPLCGKKMAMIGLGSQKLEEELGRKFPNAHVARIDSDSMRGKDYYRLLKDFSQGRIDILAGTQMLAKGLHFPNVTVVGIISADTCLYLPDFRSNERTFQLICHVAGRAGRSAKKGIVFVQTFLADQPVIRFALKDDFKGFIEAELKHRKACNLPPFWRLAAVLMRDRNFEKLESAGKSMREKIDGIVRGDKLQAIVRGPVPAPVSRVQRFHRIQIIVQAPTAEIICRLFTVLRAAGPVRPAVKVAVDVDPVSY